MSSSLA